MKKINKRKIYDPSSQSSASRKAPVQSFLQKHIFHLTIYLLIFSLSLVFLLDRTTTGFRKSESEINKTLLGYMLSNFPANVDSLYQNEIDQPMEELFNSSILTSFFFSTPNYPAGQELLSRLTKDLSSFTDNSKYISASAVYATTTDTFVTSQPKSAEAKKTVLNYMNEIIYSYNSNTLEKNQVSIDNHHTFLFHYKEYIILTKDLTTVSGAPHGTLFIFFDLDQFASLLYHSFPSVFPYSISVYDPHNNLLFTNAENGKGITQNQLINLASMKSHIKLSGNVYQTYCSSDMLRLQYVLEVSQNSLIKQSYNQVPVYLISLLSVLLLILLSAGLIFARFRKPIIQFFNILELTEADSSTSFLRLFSLINGKISALINENSTLHKIVSTTSMEALSSLFTRLITGQQVADEDIQVTLSNTRYGFRPDNIYVVGILLGSDFLEIDKRYRIMNLLNAVFDKFKSKNECNICVFPFNEESFTIIAAFSSDTSIAKGKTKVNELTRLLEENLEFSNLTMTLAFGHMYNSILDLSFSYHEAFKALNHLTEPTYTKVHTPLQESDQTETDFIERTSRAIAPPSNVDDSHAEQEMPLLSDLIDRRAFQIAQLISEGREESTSSLIERTINDIFKDPILRNQCENSKRLVGAVTQHMISYPFVNDYHLTDVYSNLSHLIDAEITSTELQEYVHEAIDILRSDFTEVLKRQRNPYIVAAQQYIEVNYSNPDLSLDEIAENLKIAPNYLSTTFSKNMGKKLFEYVNEYRLAKSIDLLINTNKPINDISVECGFGSARNYIRIFKKYKDDTPGAYRKQHVSKTIHQDSEV